MTGSRPLDCEEVLRVMFAYLDGELPASHQERVDAHLERCRSCLSRADFERRLRARLAELADDAVSPAFEDRIRGLIDGLGRTDAGGGREPAVRDS